MSSPTSGRIRPAASTSTQRMSFGSRLRVVPRRVAGHVLELGERLDARVAAADEHERERPTPLRLVVDGGGEIESTQHLVAQGDRLLDVLEPDRLFGQPRDRQRPRHRPEGDDDMVVVDAVLVAGRRLDDRTVVRVVDRRDAAGDHAAPAQDRPERHHDVSRFEAAGGGFREERLVRHHRTGIDDRDPHVTPAHRPAQAERRVHPDVATSGDQHVRRHGRSR